MSRINQHFIEELSARTDLVGLIHSRLPLKKKGNNYWACCPFHEEKSPSFSVSEEKNIYHCFGCGASGDAIRFLMDFNQLSFVESIQSLADFNGVEMVYDEALPTPNKKQTSEYKQGLACLHDANLFFQEALFQDKGKQARAYLRTRGLNMAELKHFELGYAPSSGLLAHLQQKYPLSLIKSVGLIGLNEQDNRPYDYFRNRLMFPIKNVQNQVIGFGARSLDGSQPKYLNSPETDWFSKKNELYALNSVLAERSKTAIVCEGYLDVIKLWQYGFKNAVASLGTAFGDTHLIQLKKRFSEIIFCFDGDNAGRKAGEKTLEALFGQYDERHHWRFAFLPEGQDPDDFLKNQTVIQNNQKTCPAFERICQEALLPSQFLFQILTQNYGRNPQPEQKAQLIQSLEQWLNQLPPDLNYKKLLKEEASQYFQFNAEYIQENQKLNRYSPERFTPQKALKNVQRDIAFNNLEITILSLLFLTPELAYTVRSTRYTAELGKYCPLAWALMEALQQSEDLAMTFQQFLQIYPLHRAIKGQTALFQKQSPDERRQTLLEILAEAHQRLIQQKSHLEKSNFITK